MLVVSKNLTDVEARRLDQPAAARCHRLSSGREPCPAQTDRTPAAALHGRPAPSARRESPDTRRRLLGEIATIVTPDTLAWHRTLIVSTTGAPVVVRRRRLSETALIVRMATENRGWATRDPRSPGEPQSRRLPRHDRHRPSRTRPGARARSAEEDDVDRVPEGALGGPGRRGLLYGGRLERSRADAVRRPVRHRTVDAPNSDRRHRAGAGRRLDEPDESQPDGCRRWFSDGQNAS